MKLNKFEAALRAKFKTPQDALKALGLDTNLLDDGDSRSKQMKRARDQDASTVEEILEMIDQLPEEQRLELMNQLQVTGEGEDRRSFRGTGRDRRGARDEPPPFPGRPNPGGELDPLIEKRQAEDRRRHGFGMDGLGARPFSERENADFARRFPDAARIRI